MPFLLRIIAQRIFFVILSLLAFVGIEPNVDISLEPNAGIEFADPDTTLEEVLERHDEQTTTTTIDVVTNIPLPSTNIIEELQKRRRAIEESNRTPATTDRTRPVTIIYPPTQTPVTQPDEPTPEPEKPEPEVAPDTSEEQSLENSVVNILCTQRNGNAIKLTTGSGVLVASQGIIITNAHVAQYFLLEDIGYECTIQRDNIQLYGFVAEPLYISEQWIENNFMLITHPAPVGTGEGDYALLRITGSTIPSVKLPNSFSFISPNTTAAPGVGESATVAAYPGRYSGSFDINTQLPLVTDRVTISAVYTLTGSTIDIISTDDTPVAQQGSSGGGIFKNNRLVGLIATTNPGSNPSIQKLNGITLDYIDRDLQRNTGRSLNEYLTGNAARLADSFQETVAPRLKELLLQNL